MCLFPLTAKISEFGRPVLDSEGDLPLPCGKCSECRTKRATEWAHRARHEISLHKENSFLTLTYEHEPENMLIAKEEFRKFMKRLRKSTGLKIKYMCSHEYGGKKQRMHHHLIAFGYNPPNQKLNRYAPSGEPLFTSDRLSKLWKHGFHSVGSANEKTAFYIASYALKAHSQEVTTEDGEILNVSDSMSVSKGIGLNYFLKHHDQLLNADQPLPRYYLKHLKQCAQDVFDHKMGEWIWPLPYLKYCIAMTHKLAKYQDKQREKFRSRTPHEIYAKYIINQDKINESEYRSAPDTRKRENFLKKHLRFKRAQSQKGITK